MTFDPSYPTKIIVINSDHKTSGNNTNFLVQLDNKFKSEGNFYVKVLDFTIETVAQNSSEITNIPGAPLHAGNFIGIQSSISMGTVLGISALSNLIGFQLYETQYDPVANDGIRNIKKHQSNNSWIASRSPTGAIRITLCDSEGNEIKETSDQIASYDGGNDSKYETISNVCLVLEIKQVNPLTETINEIKSRRSYQIP